MGVPAKDLVDGANITAREFAWFVEYMKRETGVVLREGKETLVTSRLNRRLRALEMSTYSEYISHLQTVPGADEALLALDLLTTNETSFFRESSHFDELGRLVRAHGPHPLRIWSAASSSGEEAISIALTVAAENVVNDWNILATDFSARVIAAAQRGLYPVEDAERIPADLRREYCLRGKGDNEGLFAVENRLRRRMTYRRLNLLEPFAQAGEFNIIFLRNVLIYFDTPTKQDILERLVLQLVAGGHLFISQTESVSGLQLPLRNVASGVFQKLSV